MTFIRNMFFTLSLLCMLACGEVKEYPWNSEWDKYESEQPTEPEELEHSDPEEPETPEPDVPETPEHGDEDMTSDVWTDVTSDFGTVPSYLSIMKSPSELQGKKSLAYVAIADLSLTQWDVWSVRSDRSAKTEDNFMTPSEVYEKYSCPVVINGGYFYYSGSSRYTSSLAVSASEVLAYNINYASEDWVTLYYPTRAAFLEYADGTFDACWTYATWNQHFIYPTPAENAWDKVPVAQPTADFPEGAKEFSAKTGIGAGPVLIDKGKVKNSYEEELFAGTSGISPDTNQPRTAIGITDENKLIFFVCEGREMTEGIKGLTTADVANVLLELGCVEAINLDGGGSSCMLVNGKETIKVSDGKQRAVASAVIIK